MNKACTALPGWTVPKDPYPYVGGDGMQPGYIPQGVIIPTLDDGPDSADPLPTDGGPGDGYNPGSATMRDLAFLNANNLHFDFFINTNNWTDPVTGDCATETDYEPHNDILLIAQTQNIGNHTMHHVLMAGEPQAGLNNPPPAPGTIVCCDCQFNSGLTCDSELANVESVVNKITNGGRPHMTRMRPPYGGLWTTSQFTSGYSGNLADEQSVTAKYAVTALWNIDDGDSNWDPSQGTPPPTGDTIAMNVMTAIQGGGYGIVLQHAVFPWTADALPKLYGPGGMIPTSKLATIEDAFCWKYGSHSWDLVGKGTMPN
jgi:peptidoglycan/xylan/chitin deacetylase (PgdA/CDA1 family)